MMMIMNGLLAMLVAMTVAAEVSSRTVPYYSATKLAVQLPRGGGGVFGTNLSKEKLAGIFVLQMAANAVIAMPAPGKMLELYGSNAPKKGSAADVFMHYIESALTAIAILTYLSVYTDAEIRTMAIWGTTPNMYQTWNLFLHGSYKSAGFHDGFGVALLLSYAPAVLLWTGKGDTALVIKYFAVVCGLLSLLLIFGSDDLAKSMFGVSVADGYTKSIFKWSGRFGFMLAALLWNLVSPRKLDSLQVVSIVAGLNAIFSVDSAYLTKDALGSMPNLNAMVPPLSVLLDTVIAAGLLSN